MANLLDRFNKNVRGSSGRIVDYISIISSKGDFKQIRNLDVILNSWNNILLTPLRTYLFDPEFGSNLYKMVFEPVDQNTVDRIKTEIENSLLKYDDRAAITNINISFLQDGKGFNVDITVDYEGEEGNLSLTLDEGTYFKFLETV